MNVEKQLSSQENHPNIRLKMESSNYFLMIYGQTYGFPINCMARHKAQRAAMSRIEALRSPCCFTLLKKTRNIHSVNIIGTKLYSGQLCIELSN